MRSRVRSLGQGARCHGRAPGLDVLNACESLEGADNLLRTVPTVIGMSESTANLAAVTFAVRFHAAIASARSVATAGEQVRTAMQIASL